jgi:hypothetical protein
MNKNLHTIYVGLFFLIGIAVISLLGYNGYSYYQLPLSERHFNAQHDVLKPSGYWGHAFGIIGTLMMLFGVVIYMIRKRSKRWFTFGYLKHWLELHIFLCTVGPILVLYHTAFKFGGLVAVSFWSMVAVVLSGVIGRFIYVQIPRSISGQELSMRELNDMSLELRNKLQSALGYNGNNMLLLKLETVSSPSQYEGINAFTSFPFIFRNYFQRREIISLIKGQLKDSLPENERSEIIVSAKDRMIIARRIGLLSAMQGMFKYWHIVHLPFAITMFVIMLIHVAVTILFGYRWIF